MKDNASNSINVVVVSICALAMIWSLSLFIKTVSKSSWLPRNNAFQEKKYKLLFLEVINNQQAKIDSFYREMNYIEAGISAYDLASFIRFSKRFSNVRGTLSMDNMNITEKQVRIYFQLSNKQNAIDVISSFESLHPTERHTEKE